MQVFETQQLVALVVEGEAGGGLLRLSEINVLRNRGSFRHLLERGDASLAFVVTDAATCHGKCCAAPAVIVWDDGGVDNGRLVPDAVPEISMPSRWLDPEEEISLCVWLRALCLELKRDLGEGCDMRPLQHEGWQQRRHRELAEEYRKQRGVLLDNVADSLDAHCWLSSVEDGSVNVAC